VQVVILAGGLGTRLEEETTVTPKPLVMVGGYPILWHIMKIYSHYGFNEFIICLGYKGHLIKEYFQNYSLHCCDVTFDFTQGERRTTFHNMSAEPWKVTLVDTGQETQTGGRVKRIAPFLTGDEFMLTYGDGVADVDIPALIAEHKAHGRIATVTAIQPPGKFGVLQVASENSSCPIEAFIEKPIGSGGWISGGFFVLKKKAIDYIDGDSTPWEQEPLRRLAEERQLMPYFHRGFWQCMDTIRHKRELEALWNAGNSPWKLW